MSRPTRPVRRLLLAATMTVLLGTAACGSADSPTATSATDAVAIVADSHANAPTPTLTERTAAVVKDAMINGGRVSLIRVSGTPTVTNLHLAAVEGTSAGREAAVNRNLASIARALTRGVTTDGADDLEAISRAVDTLRGTNAAHPVIIFTGSGIGDRGRLDFTAQGMLSASPGDVNAYLSRTGALPDLKGITVYLTGLGYTTQPQQPLDAAQRGNVVNIWQSVLKSAGADVVTIPDARTGTSVNTTATVRPIAVPTVATPAMCSTTEIVFGQQSAVSFVAETNTFVDTNTAIAALAPIADWLIQNRDRRVVIRGTTADDRGDHARLKELGQRRADAVAEFLIHHGVAETQITATGVGADFPEYVRPDTDPATGLLLPGPAAVNRSVRIALTDPC